MKLEEIWKREKYVAIHGQSRKFRIIKWIIILAIAWWLYYFIGLEAVAYFFLSAAVLGIALHFFLRWKTKGWTRAWGPVKPMLRKRK